MGGTFSRDNKVNEPNIEIINNKHDNLYHYDKNDCICKIKTIFDEPRAHWIDCKECNARHYMSRHCYECHRCVPKNHCNNCHWICGNKDPKCEQYKSSCVYINNYTCRKCNKEDINYVKHTDNCLKTNVYPESFDKKCDNHILINYMHKHNRILLCYDCEYDNYQCNECETCCYIDYTKECSCNDCKSCYEKHLSIDNCEICNKNDDKYFYSDVNYKCCEQYKPLLKNIYHNCQYNKNYEKNHEKIKHDLYTFN